MEERAVREVQWEDVVTTCSMRFDDVMHVRCLAQHQARRKKLMGVSCSCMGGWKRRLFQRRGVLDILQTVQCGEWQNESNAERNTGVSEALALPQSRS